SCLLGCHLLRGLGAVVANLTPLVPFGCGKRRSRYILLQQIERRSKKYDILHEESHVAFHRREAGSRVPAVRHERDDGDSSDHGKTATEGPENAGLLVPETPEQERGKQPFRRPEKPASSPNPEDRVHPENQRAVADKRNQRLGLVLPPLLIPKEQ